MARETYGKTWWGQQWLNALSQIDYSNRLPRGAAYARRGAVREIKVEGGSIKAKVSGTQPSPYKIFIKVPQFKDAEKKKLIDAIAQHPQLVSKLINHELSPQAMSISREVGVKLFPDSWRDLPMSCSCPDWAVPCKHIAAVIYMMSREIDNDPFLVFSMHGIDLVEELRQRGMATNESGETNIPATSSIYKVVKSKDNPDKEPHRIDFTTLTDISSPLVDLLPVHPTFDDNDFREIYRHYVKANAREARQIVTGRTMWPFPGSTPLKVPSSGLQDAPVSFRILLDDNMEAVNLDFDVLLAAVSAIDDDDLFDYPAETIVLHQAMHTALHLLAVGAVAPMLVKGDRGGYRVLWHPANGYENACSLLRQIDDFTPANMVCWQQVHLKKPSLLANTSYVLVSMVLQRLVPKLSPQSAMSPVAALLFKGNTELFDGVAQQSIPGSIATWLAHLDVKSRKYQPHVVVNVKDEKEFLIDVAVPVNTVPTSLSEILTQPGFAPIRVDVLRDVDIISPFLPGFDAYVRNEARTPMRFTLSQFSPLLMEKIPSLRLLGVAVALPREMQQILRPRMTLSIGKKQAKDSVGKLNFAEMLDFDWRVALGENILSEDEFVKLVVSAHGLVNFKGQYFYISDSEALNILTKIKKASERLTTGQCLQAALSGSYDNAPIIMTEDLRQTIHQLRQQREIALPRGLRATLRPYQQRGFEWMYRNFKIGFGSILADDMGLGKTIQVITLLQKLKTDGELKKAPAMVVVPATLLSNWQSELSRFAPRLTCLVYHGSGRSLKGFKDNILLTTYGIVRSDVEKLKKREWHTIVIDEAQNIKNADTAQSKAIHSLNAQNRIAMSGTPIENRLSEFWSIMNFANPGLLGSSTAFRKEYANPIQRDGSTEVAERFRQVTSPFLMRRLKTDKNIIADLPDKVEEDTIATLTDRQAALYHETVEAAMATISEAPTDSPQALFKRQGLVLQMILALKQVCNHPALFLKNGDTDPALSGKAEMLLTMLDSIVRNKQKVLVFTQFREMGDLLVRFIRERLGETPLFLHGGVPVKERSHLVDDFQNRPECRIFVLSIKAAGTGLNLTAASHVIHYDLWWNPAVEAQATDRAYRIGQHQNVIVHRFITQGTFEEQINRMIQEKKHLADMTVATGENWIGNLSNEELRNIFSPTSN